jgi:hypothetical protein
MKWPRLLEKQVARIVIIVEQRSEGYVSVVNGKLIEGDVSSRSNLKHTPEETVPVAMERVERLLRQQLKENV